jgi:hypothetical protein
MTGCRPGCGGVPRAGAGRKRVSPTPEQTPRIQAHLDRAVQQLLVIRADTITRTTDVIWRLVTEVEQELTPEQRKAFEAMKPKPADLTPDMLKVGPKPQSKW